MTGSLSTVTAFEHESIIRITTGVIVSSLMATPSKYSQCVHTVMGGGGGVALTSHARCGSE
jgi:hypothetical protein